MSDQSWPLPGLRPMLAVTAWELPTEPGWAFEPKWDGYRALGYAHARQLQLRSRRGLDMAAWFPELAGLAHAVGGHQLIIDGEVVALNPAGQPDFELLQQRMRRRHHPQAARRSAPVAFMVFDLVWVDGQPLLATPWAERRARLEALTLAGPAWQTSPAYLDHGPLVDAATREQGLEGVVAKRAASPYRPGQRSDDWRKRSHLARRACRVGGFIPGTLGVEQLLVGIPEPDGRLRYAGRVEAGLVPGSRRRLATLLAPLVSQASPFTDDAPMRAGRWQRTPAPGPAPVWVRPLLAVRIEYRGLEGRQLRHPRYAGLIGQLPR